MAYHGKEIFLSLKHKKARFRDSAIVKAMNSIALRNAFTMVGPVRKLFQPFRDIPRMHYSLRFLENVVPVPFQVLSDAFDFYQRRKEFRKQLKEMMPTIAKGRDDMGSGLSAALAESAGRSQPQDSASTSSQTTDQDEKNAKRDRTNSKNKQRRVPISASLDRDSRGAAPSTQALEQENKEERKEIKKSKEKTRGVADPSRARDAAIAAPPITRQAEGPTPEQVEHERQRMAGLARVRELQAVYPLSFETVEAELKALVRFLPEGRLEQLEGIEWKISWRDHRGRIQDLKYETPHGRDANQFRGKRLNNVLDKIELAYLWGWEEESINQYMSENLGSCLFKLPRFIYNALIARQE